MTFESYKNKHMKYLNNSTLQLRLPELSDLDFFYNTENNTDLWEISNSVQPVSAYTLKKYIEHSDIDLAGSKQLRLVIERKADKAHIGMIDLFDYEPIHLRAGIGIYIQEKEQGKGYAAQALQLLIAYCTDILRLHQLYCNVGSDNEKSIRLFKKAGFQHTGTKTQWLNTSEGFKDVLFFQLILQN